MVNKKYKALFFDLDHTLWDYDTNSLETLKFLHEKHLSHIFEFNSFHDNFQVINNQLWDFYALGKITREEIRSTRFNQLFEVLKHNEPDLAHYLTHEYTKLGPIQKGLMPGAFEVLEYLHKRYPLYIITNGFEDIQDQKLHHSGIKPHFKGVITSDKAGINKPSPQIFEYALDISDCKADEALMVGDNLISDVQGAINASIDIAFYNHRKEQHDKKVTFEIGQLSELVGLL